MTHADPRLSEDAAQKVLARALELQTQSAGALTVAQIRQIASDLAIPESAVDQALSEYRASTAAAVSSPSGPAPVATSERRIARALMITMAVVGGTISLLTIIAIVWRFFP
jgi:hypothetical protein